LGIKGLVVVVVKESQETTRRFIIGYPFALGTVPLIF
jgi:hypothetical protein